MIDKKMRKLIAELIEEQVAPERGHLKQYIVTLNSKLRTLERKVARLKAGDDDRDDDVDDDEELC